MSDLPPDEQTKDVVILRYVVWTTLLATFLTAFLLSGFLYAIEQMPVVLQRTTRILPARYYVSVLKKLLLKGSPTALLYADLVPLAIFTLVLALLATHSFQKRLT